MVYSDNWGQYLMSKPRFTRVRQGTSAENGP